MKNILVLTNSIDGLYCFRKEVMKALTDAGYDLYISYPGSHTHSEWFERIGCRLLYTPFKRRGMNPVADLRLLYTYRQLIKRVRPVAVLTYTIKPNVYGGMAAALCRVPLIANVTGMGDAIENQGLLGRLAIRLYRAGLRKAHRVFFQNAANRTVFINSGIVTPEQTCLIPGSGVNTDYHRYQAYPDDEQHIKFLFIARLLKDKGTDEYFAAAAALTAKYPGTEFQVLGNNEGDYQQQLEALSRAGIIHYLGKTDDVRPYIGRVHCTVLPSYHEGMSNVNLESEANGRPVITTNAPGCRETVTDGVTGFLVKPRSTEDLIEKLETFIHLPNETRRRMGIAAREKVQSEFDRQIVVDAYVKAVKGLLYPPHLTRRRRRETYRLSVPLRSVTDKAA